MKKILAIFCCLCLTVNIVFAFDPYADEEPEVRSKSKLYWGIFMTLVGGFLAYDGFSQEEVDISKPSVDYGGKINYMYYQNQPVHAAYTLYSGNAMEGDPYIEKNILYNNGNVDLFDVKVYVRYTYVGDNEYIMQHEYSASDDHGKGRDHYFRGNDPNDKSQWVQTYFGDDYYIEAENQIKDNILNVGKGAEWSDSVSYGTGGSSPPGGSTNTNEKDVFFQENALEHMDVKVTYKYNHKYKKQNKSDIEGVAGLMIATAGIYFIVDYLVDLHKFNRYMKRNDINIRLANAPNEYKLLFQKRL